MISQFKPTERFSTKVGNYVKHRPHYPQAVIELLRDACGLSADWAIADIGSGTGISSELFLANGNRVYGVEPNAAMRAAGEAYLSSFPNFVSVAATAEQTTLSDGSVDMAIAGQAFHWFDRARAREEFARILRPGGWLVLMWNSRDESSPFQQDYERLVSEYGIDYSEIRHQNITDEALATFFGPGAMKTARFRQAQLTDFDGLAGRVLSSSYMPDAEHARYEPMMTALRKLFAQHARDGRLSLDLVTVVYYGRLT